MNRILILALLSILLPIYVLYAYSPTNEDLQKLEEVKVRVLKIHQEDSEKVQKLWEVITVLKVDYTGQLRYILDEIDSYIDKLPSIDVSQDITTPEPWYETNYNRLQQKEFKPNEYQMVMLEKYENLIDLYSKTTILEDKVTLSKEIHELSVEIYFEKKLTEEGYFNIKDKQKWATEYLMSLYDQAISIDTLEAYNNVKEEYDRLRNFGNFPNKDQELRDSMESITRIINEVNRGISTKIKSGNIDDPYFFVKWEYLLDLLYSWDGHFSIVLQSQKREYIELLVNEVWPTNKPFYLDIPESGYYYFDVSSSRGSYSFTVEEN